MAFNAKTIISLTGLTKGRISQITHRYLKYGVDYEYTDKGRINYTESGVTKLLLIKKGKSGRPQTTTQLKSIQNLIED